MWTGLLNIKSVLLGENLGTRSYAFCSVLLQYSINCLGLSFTILRSGSCSSFFVFLSHFVLFSQRVLWCFLCFSLINLQDCRIHVNQKHFSNKKKQSCLVQLKDFAWWWWQEKSRFPWRHYDLYNINDKQMGHEKATKNINFFPSLGRSSRFL